MFSIEKERDTNELRSKVIDGFLRLAEADVSDAVKLIFAEKVNTAGIRKMDLHAIASIKKVKDGMEIGFYNRFEALEKLWEISGTADSGEAFLKALSEGAKAMEAEKAED